MGKPVFMLTLDQGTQAGPALDLPGWGEGRLKRVFDALSVLEGKFNVTYSVCGTAPDFPDTVALLDTLVSNRKHYVLDVVSSDALAMGINSWHAPYDCQHQIPMPIQHVQSMYARGPDGDRPAHAPFFDGVRCHEAVYSRTSVSEWRMGHNHWWDGDSDYLPVTGSVFEPVHVDPFLSWAASLPKPEGADQPPRIFWNEPKWEEPAAIVRGYANHWPNRVVPIWSNNVDGAGSEMTFLPKLDAVRKGKILWWGVSLQTWAWNARGYADGVPVDYFVRAAVNALKLGAYCLSFEAAAGFFNVPSVWDFMDPRFDGSPTPLGQALISGLLAA